MNRKLYIETYGCQMNLNDSEIVGGIMQGNGWEMTDNIELADAILLNTCSVRENAEDKIFKRIKHIENQFKKRRTKLVVGIIGCMAERFHEHLIEMQNIISIVIGPDEYRKLPVLLDQAYSGNKAVAVELSKVETYDDIAPLRTEGISTWISIMRGCNNFCSYCVVPFTRGRERSRPMKSIIEEASALASKGFKEITLLGQNVNSYLDEETNSHFHELIQEVAKINRQVRIRFTTSHPRDMSDELIDSIANNSNICNHIHLPVQSGSNNVLQRMNRRYTIDSYLNTIEKIYSRIPNVSITTDIIAGYPGETNDDHTDTLNLIKKVQYSGSFMFKYSHREGTKAYDEADDVEESEKLRRLNEIIDLQNSISKELNLSEIGKSHEVLVESPSKRNEKDWMGRTTSNKVVIFSNEENKYKAGDYINVIIKSASSATLFGEVR